MGGFGRGEGLSFATMDTQNDADEDPTSTNRPTPFVKPNEKRTPSFDPRWFVQCIVVPALGFGLLRLWIMLVEENSAVFTVNPGLFLTSWLGRGVFPLFMVVLLNSLSLSLKSSLQSMVAATIMAVCGGIALTLPISEGDGALALGAIVGTAGIGWLYVCWAETYSNMRIRDVAISMMASLVFSSLAALLFGMAPSSVKFCCLIVFPLVTTYSFFVFMKKGLPEKEFRTSFSLYEREQMLTVNGRWLTMLAIYSFILGAIHVISTFQAKSETTAAPFEVYIAASITLAGLLLVFVVMNRLPSSRMFWLIVTAAIGASLVMALAFPPMLQVILSLFAAVRYVAIGYINVKFVDIAHHSRVPGYVVFAMGWGIIQIGMAFGACVTLYGLESIGLNLDVVATMILAVLAMGTLMLTSSSEISDVFVGETAPQKESGNLAQESLENMLMAQCRNLRERYGLSERETEIVFLVAQGHTQIYCAEALVVSINTIRSHMKHIYSKLNIHSKDELLQALRKEGEFPSASNGILASSR